MSLLSQLQEKKRKLSKSTTVVTTISGRKFEEILRDDGSFDINYLHERRTGYVIDTKPDLQVAEILPYLLLGSQDVAADRDLLLSHKISHILSIGVTLTTQFSDFQYETVELNDTPCENIIDVLRKTNNLITIVRRCETSKVFVHCNAGCSRAPSVVIGYLIKTYNLSYEEAHSIVSQKRYIRPNAGFVEQLKMYANAALNK